MLQPKHEHYFLIPTQPKTVEAACLLCGERRLFHNVLPDSPIQRPRVESWAQGLASVKKGQSRTVA